MRSSADFTANRSDFEAYDDFAATIWPGAFELTCPSCDHLLTGRVLRGFPGLPRMQTPFLAPPLRAVRIVADHGSFRDLWHGGLGRSADPSGCPTGTTRRRTSPPVKRGSPARTIGGREAVLSWSIWP